MSMTITEYSSAMTERNLQNTIVAAAQRLGLTVYHTHNSRHSEPGFPDLIIVHLAHEPHESGVFALEIKRQHGRVSLAQRDWLDGLNGKTIRSAVVRPEVTDDAIGLDDVLQMLEELT